MNNASGNQNFVHFTAKPPLFFVHIRHCNDNKKIRCLLTAQFTQERSFGDKVKRGGKKRQRIKFKPQV